MIKHANVKELNRSNKLKPFNNPLIMVITNTIKQQAIKTEDQALKRALEIREQILAGASFQELAKELIKDAEGATKFITVVVKEGRDKEECAKVAYCVAESPLVKTALFASDANWGRILAAVGRADLDNLDTRSVNIDIGDVRIVTKGNLEETYTEEKGASAMKLDELIISIQLGRGNKQETVWTSDLSHDYVRINADYRT